MLPSTGLRWPAIRARTTKRVMAVHISPLVRHKDSPVMMAGGGALRPPSPGNLNLGVGVSAANDFESLTLGSRDFGAGGGAGSGREGEERGWEGRRDGGRQQQQRPCGYFRGTGGFCWDLKALWEESHFGSGRVLVSDAAPLAGRSWRRGAWRRTESKQQQLLCRCFDEGPLGHPTPKPRSELIKYAHFRRHNGNVCDDYKSPVTYRGHAAGRQDTTFPAQGQNVKLYRKLFFRRHRPRLAKVPSPLPPLLPPPHACYRTPPPPPHLSRLLSNPSSLPLSPRWRNAGFVRQE